MMTVRHNALPVLRRPIYFAIPCEVKRQSAHMVFDYVTETLHGLSLYSDGVMAKKNSLKQPLQVVLGRARQTGTSN